MKNQNLNHFFKFFLVLHLIRCSFFSYSQEIKLSLVSPTDKGCSPLELCFQNSTSPVGIDRFEWDFNNDGIAEETYGPENAGQTVCHTFISNPFQGRVFLVAVRKDGSQDGAFVTISVYHPNIPAIGVLPSLVCAGKVDLQNTSTLGDDGSIHITSWDFGDGSPVMETNQLSVQHEFVLEGNLTITMIDSNSCGSSTTSAGINVNLLTTKIVSSSNDTVCQGEPVKFSNSDDSPNMSYTWDFGDGTPISKEINPTHRFLNDGDYIVSLQVEIPDGIGCSDNVTFDVIVLPGPIAEFISFFSAGQCDSASVNFTDFSSEIIAGDKYLWDFGNSKTLTSASVPESVFYDSSGYFYPILTITRGGNGCISEFNDTILIPQTPIALFTADNVCLGQSAQFMDATASCVPSVYGYSWDFGDGTTDTIANPAHIYNLPGEKVVKFSVTNGYCNNDTTLLVTVKDLPHPFFELNLDSGCSIVNIVTNNQTPDGVDYIWSFGNLTKLFAKDTSYNIENTSQKDTIIDVWLIAITSGCTDSISKPVKVFQTPVAIFSSEIKPIPVCVPDTVTFTSLATGSTSLEWDFGDNTSVTDSIITHIFENDQHYFRYYKVDLIARSENGCTDTASQYITLYPKPNTDFVMDTLPVACDSVKVLLTAPEEFNGDYTWVFKPPGDTVKKSDWHAAYTFSKGNTDQIIQVKLITENQFGCFGDTVKSLTIYRLPPPPDPDFIPYPLSGCSDLTVNFRDLSTNTDTTTYIWDFGDGTRSYDRNPEHTFFDAGDKTVRLTAQGLDCSTSQKDTIIQVFETPNASFNVTPDTPWIPDNPVFCSPVYQSVNWQYAWNFGDTITSDSMEVAHYYKDTLTYKISLFIVTENGCTASASKNIKGKVAGSIKSPNVFFPNIGGGGGGGGSGDGGGQVGDGDDVFAPVTEGVVEYHLEVYDRWGERLFHSNSKDIGWTGYYQGKLCKEDVYVWKVFGKYANNIKFIKAGTITLLQR
jgi:PKD repeat protein